jgi:hypothetical protein
MMIEYVPFLKLKSNEIMGLSVLEGDLIERIAPFFDYAKRKDLTEENFTTTSVKMYKSLKKNASRLNSMYIDNYDIDTDFEIEGIHNYYYLLDLFKDFSVIPVVSIDRSQEHIDSVCSAKDTGINNSSTIALRLTPEDFQNFDLVEDEIDDLQTTFDRFETIDLILDSRVCLNQDPEVLSENISSFINSFRQNYDARKIIVTGSSIPASIRDITPVESEVDIERVELDIFHRVTKLVDEDVTVTLGDYGAVSPNYSDVDGIPGGAMRNITAPKIIYAHDTCQYVIRGGALSTHPDGDGQYKNLALTLLAKPFFRNEPYSFGDKYIGEKSRGVGSNATPSTMVKPLCNAHISYMCKDYV